MRELAKAGVMIGFCGGSGSPLFAATEIEWLSAQSEYWPTKYLQQWCAFWFDDGKRLEAAKRLQQQRLDTLAALWPQHDWQVDEDKLADLIKDAMILPQAFISTRNGDSERDFRRHCMERLTHCAALNRIIATLQTIARETAAP